MTKRKRTFIFESDALEFQAYLTKEGVKSEGQRGYNEFVVIYYV